MSLAWQHVGEGRGQSGGGTVWAKDGRGWGVSL